MRFVLISGVLFLAFVPEMLGAQDSGTLTGRVEDSTTRAGIAGTEVIATHVETGSETTVVTSATGIFRMANLPVGEYRLELSPPNAQGEIHSNIELAAGETRNFDYSADVYDIGDGETAAASGRLAIIGVVLNEEAGVPVAGAQVVVMGPGEDVRRCTA
jgi:hypothetical protein